MSDYKPGTVAMATVQGQPNVRVCRIKTSGDHEVWYSADPIGGSDYHWHGDEITDIRPLVVLDLKQISSAGHGESIAWCIEKHTADHCELVQRVADQIREQAKPPRIDEPGLYGVVNASLDGVLRTSWVHHTTGWYRAADDQARLWDDLIDPVLVREGVQS